MEGGDGDAARNNNLKLKTGNNEKFGDEGDEAACSGGGARGAKSEMSLGKTLSKSLSIMQRTMNLLEADNVRFEDMGRDGASLERGVDIQTQKST